MPRGIPKSKTEQIQQVRQAEQAQQLLSILEETMSELKEQYFKMAMSQPISDLESIRQEYLAANRIADTIRFKINKGKIAKAKLEKEEN